MKIAFISYEYPPDTACGGIATYVYQASRMLASRGHQVEVFAGSDRRNSTIHEDSILVHRISVERTSFSSAISQVFTERHKVVQFDVLEGPECHADAAEAVRQASNIPLVIKLHTPRYILGIVGKPPSNWLLKTRFMLGAIRRGKLPKYSQPYNPHRDPERIHALEADEIAAPSLAIGNRLIADWGLDTEKVAHVPYPYIPSANLLSIPINTQTNTVTFIGRLEVRKGILDLARAIPKILQRHPQTKFRFVGPAWPSPNPCLDMRQYIEKQLKRYPNSLEFTGRVSLEEIPSILAKTDICVFPSIWESFGLVCLEAMSAGRGVVGSSAGGMAELLDGGKVGRLVPPRSPKSIAKAVIELLDAPEERMQLGKAARERVLGEYNLERVGLLQEASYKRAIERRQALGVRHLVGQK